MFDPQLTIGQVIDNAQLCATFGCGPQGGMRRSHKTDTLVLVSNHVESIYDDRWIDDVFHYTGMGQVGPQSLEFMQNKTLAQSAKNGVGVHLFEVDTPQQYRYEGRVLLAGKPYEESQLDSTGQTRTVWMFPLKPVTGEIPTITKSEFEQHQIQREKKARRLSDDELVKRAAAAPEKPGERTTTGTSLERNPYVAEVAKRRAKGICQLCETPAPFKSKRGEPYLETHHVQWLSKGGADSLANTVALCPNCHRKMHVVNSDADRAALLKTVAQFAVLVGGDAKKSTSTITDAAAID